MNMIVKAVLFWALLTCGALAQAQTQPTAAPTPMPSTAPVAAPKPAAPRPLRGAGAPPCQRMVADWLLLPHVRFLDLLLGDGLHEELLKRAGPLLGTLAAHGRLTTSHVDRMWLGLLAAHASAADLHRDLLAAVAERGTFAAPALVRHLYAKIAQAADHQVAHRRRARADHDHDLLAAGRLDRVDDPVQQGAAAHLVQHLWEGGLHPRALAGG